MSGLGDALWLIMVAVLWGTTNPLMKSAGVGIENIKKSNVVLQFFSELWFLLINWKYMVPFVINQSGSLIYYLTLASAELSLAVPITNSLTFVFTAIMGHILGEKISLETLFGMVFILAGIGLCLLSKG